MMDVSDVPTASKRSKREDVPLCLSRLPEWFASVVCPFLTTRDACHMRAAAPSLHTVVASYPWDDLSCRIPFQHMQLWRKCFPVAWGAHVELPTLAHHSITTSEPSPTAAPPDAIFEQFKGLSIKGVKGYVISDAAFACLSGISNLSIPGWSNIPLFTVLRLQHLSGVRKLDFTETFSLHITSEGFRHLSGIQVLQMVAAVRSKDGVAWRMTDTALSHLRGIHQLALSECYCDATSEALAAPGITDAGFAHLCGIQELQLDFSSAFVISGVAFFHLRGIASLELNCMLSELVTDDVLAYLTGIESLTLGYAPHITDVGLRHLAGVKKLHISYCPQHWRWIRIPTGIRDLDVSYCPLVTDAVLRHLRGIHSLNLSGCEQLTDSAFGHLAGIDTLIMNECEQDTISDKAFTHLAGIRSLSMCCFVQSSITSECLHVLAGIEHLDMAGCQFEVDAKTFSRLRSLTSLEMSGASLPTIFAALSAFQGNAAVEAGLWQELVHSDLGPIDSELDSFAELATAKSMMPMLRSHLLGSPRKVELVECRHCFSGRFCIAEVDVAARCLVRVVRRPSERRQRNTDGVVEGLMAYLCDQSWGRVHYVVCSALEALCEYPEFAAQVRHHASVATWARVFSLVHVGPFVEFDTWRGATHVLLHVGH